MIEPLYTVGIVVVLLWLGLGILDDPLAFNIPDDIPGSQDGLDDDEA